MISKNRLLGTAIPSMLCQYYFWCAHHYWKGYEKREKVQNHQEGGVVRERGTSNDMKWVGMMCSWANEEVPEWSSGPPHPLSHFSLLTLAVYLSLLCGLFLCSWQKYADVLTKNRTGNHSEAEPGRATVETPMPIPPGQILNPMKRNSGKVYFFACVSFIWHLGDYSQ